MNSQLFVVYILQLARTSNLTRPYQTTIGGFFLANQPDPRVFHWLVSRYPYGGSS